MDSIKFAKIDFMKTMEQSKLVPLFILISAFFGKNMGYMWPVLYLAFGGMIFVTTPFFSEMVSEAGFFSMLPAKVGSKTRGRYLYAAGYLFLCTLSGFIVSMALVFLFNEEGAITELADISILFFAVVVIFNSIQFLILTFLKIKNAQVMGIIRMLIPFTLFFGIGGIMDSLQIESGDVILLFHQWNKSVISLAAIGAAFVLTLICCELSVQKEKHDYF